MKTTKDGAITDLNGKCVTLKDESGTLNIINRVDDKIEFVSSCHHNTITKKQFKEIYEYLCGECGGK